MRGGGDIAGELTRLFVLRHAGALSDADFSHAKRSVLHNVGGGGRPVAVGSGGEMCVYATFQGKVLPATVGADATAGDVLGAIGAPPHASVVFQGRELRHDALLADEGVGAQAEVSIECTRPITRIRLEPRGEPARSQWVVCRVTLLDHRGATIPQVPDKWTAGESSGTAVPKNVASERVETCGGNACWATQTGYGRRTNNAWLQYDIDPPGAVVSRVIYEVAGGYSRGMGYQPEKVHLEITDARGGVCSFTEDTEEEEEGEGGRVMVMRCDAVPDREALRDRRVRIVFDIA